MKISMDLHTHSIFSDGEKTPREIVLKAKEEGIDVIALTDHNTFDGVSEFRDACVEVGQKGLVGIELSTRYPLVMSSREIHILGLYPLDTDFDSPVFEKFKAYLGRQTIMKAKQNDKIVSALAADFPEVSVDGFHDFVSDVKHVNRAHIAMYLVKIGIAKDIKDAFSNFIGFECKYYVRKDTINTGAGISYILKTGGIPIVAHMGEYSHITDRKEFYEYLMIRDIRGFEVFHPSNSPEIRDDLIQFCKDHDLMITAGSDYHGKSKPQQIGEVLGHGKEISCEDTKLIDDYFKKYIEVLFR